MKKQQKQENAWNSDMVGMFLVGISVGMMLGFLLML